jgi:hypothetical protein
MNFEMRRNVDFSIFAILSDNWKVQWWSKQYKEVWRRLAGQRLRVLCRKNKVIYFFFSFSHKKTKVSIFHNNFTLYINWLNGLLSNNRFVMSITSVRAQNSLCASNWVQWSIFSHSTSISDYLFPVVFFFIIIIIC